MSSSNTPSPSILKTTFLSLHGIWSPQWESLLHLDPSYFAAYLRLRSAASTSPHLPRKF